MTLFVNERLANSIINNVYITFKYGFPVIFLSFFSLAICCLCFYIIDVAKELEEQEEESTEVEETELNIGGNYARQRPIYLAMWHGINLWRDLVFRTLATCARSIRNKIISIYQWGNEFSPTERVYCAYFCQIVVMGLSLQYILTK